METIRGPEDDDRMPLRDLADWEKLTNEWSNAYPDPTPPGPPSSPLNSGDEPVPSKTTRNTASLLIKLLKFLGYQ